MSLWKKIAARYGTASEVDDIRIDSKTNALYTLSYEHHEAHEGDAFIADIVDESMADDETLSLAFKTPTGTKLAHVIIEASTLVGGDLKFYEGATWIQGSGSAVSIINHLRTANPISSILLENRQQATFTASDELIGNVTGVNVGSATLLTTRWMWGVRNRSAAGQLRGQLEFILKADTQYLILFTANGGSNAAQVSMNWYEHTDSH